MVLSHPIQYYSPWFSRINQCPDVELRVFYLSDHGARRQTDAEFGTAIKWDRDLLAGYSYEMVPNRARHPNVSRFNGLKNPALRTQLRAFRPTAILLFGYAYRTHLSLLMRPPVPILFRGDSHLLGGPPAHGIKRVLLRLIYSRCAAFLPVGLANAAYFRHFGVPESKLFPAPHCVDAEHFRPTAERLSLAEEQRQRLAIPSDAPVALFSGKLIPKKRPDLLLAAFRRAAVPHSHLILAGDGEMQVTLRQAADGLSNVHVLPFANQSEMPIRYLLGDVYILPSEGRYETWGLAVNESMHLGRPSIVSDHVGCHPDLIIPGETGWTFAAGNEEALSECLSAALRLGRSGLAIKGEAARRHIARFSYDAATEGLLAALRTLVTKKPPSR